MFTSKSAVPALWAALLISAVAATSAEWPQWLGPMRNGTSSEENLLLEWPDAGPEVIWRNPLGRGFSAVSVAGGRLFTMYADSLGEYAVCLEAASGRELWRVRTGKYYEENQGGDGPRSTPTVDAETVYVLGAEGGLFALKTEGGEVIWKKDLVAEFGGQVPRWGFSTSPLVEGELLLVEAGGAEGSFLVDMVIDRTAPATAVALDRRTGRTVWSALDDKMSYSSPVSYSVDGMRQVAFINAYALVGLSPDKGTELWRFPWKTRYDVSAATPVFIPPDRIFISSGDKGAVLRVAGEGIEEVWRSGEMQNHFGTSIYHEGHLYGFDTSILKCMDAADGTTRWQARGYAKGTLILVAGHLILLGEQGNLGLAEANPERFVEKANVALMKGRCWTVPSLSEGILYMRDETEIVAVDLRPAEAPQVDITN